MQFMYLFDLHNTDILKLIILHWLNGCFNLEEFARRLWKRICSLENVQFSSNIFEEVISLNLVDLVFQSSLSLLGNLNWVEIAVLPTYHTILCYQFILAEREFTDKFSFLLFKVVINLQKTISSIIIHSRLFHRFVGWFLKLLNSSAK